VNVSGATSPWGLLPGPEETLDQPWPMPEYEAASGWAPPDVDLRLPSAARMYDYFLGGSHNFQVDREMAGQVLAAVPDFPATARANRDTAR
jgi:S-adenosyl methyltransferase